MSVMIQTLALTFLHPSRIRDDVRRRRGGGWTSRASVDAPTALPARGRRARARRARTRRERHHRARRDARRRRHRARHHRPSTSSVVVERMNARLNE